MSGTSLDGVDAVIIDTNATKLLAQTYLPYTDELKQQLRTLTQTGQTSLKNLADIDVKVAQFFSDAVNDLLATSNVSAIDIKAIGSHGQTIFHQGGKYSMQIGHGALIAERTGIAVVSDFRMNDVAASGQGAPLTPAYHQHLLKGKDGVVVNLGGIANLTQVALGTVTGFDTGPANTLLDNWVKKSKQLDYDRDGIWARSGLVDEHLLTALLADDYFQKLEPYLTGDETDVDVQRTLVELTAMSISKHISEGADVYLCGGGVHNLFLAERLAYLNQHSEVATTNDLGIHVDYVEAAAFGFFAKQTLEGRTSNLPSVTGAKGARVLGAVCSAGGVNATS
ncbi:Anhydro-N-acetylmuramic acid kinase [hydrothermal vent metagenome]|uniref:Anhydro-N-acetylmuramic acid kinase n=1 Tax=hydrothermal vent metagenome TaxID=652676 RepID=A0A1W1DLT6_9ZZZZ